ncbi:class I SAM-dependent rRNA methyltransferase [Fontisphaera persica]|uniref:class I SAM-dependent rRNA methyltransferase n=1 Tax=Fontisphaera persica TaxID=2974023 RepID=UPI0024BFA483|nr:class I SAM-dependent rRNA methyltransferase [Fontisphaera persica]WCJ59321.1 class I SAM-dependent rRNA methyltransferase [Fontisphaera persica]
MKARRTSPTPESATPEPSPEGLPVVEPAARVAPWVQLKYITFHPCIYPAMIKAASPDARPGCLVHVYDKQGRPFGAGWYHPKARVPLRMIYHGPETISESFADTLLERALDLRLRRLNLPAQTEAFRVVHSDGDGLGGLVVDRFADVLSVEVHSLAAQQRLERWLARLHQALGTRRVVLEVDAQAAKVEGIPLPSAMDTVRSVRVREHGIQYEIHFATGHKTGFFCDQRDNRLRLRAWAAGARVLDLCCYTGGFALNAAAHGAAEVTGVDLDEAAIAQARRNANLNQLRVQWVHCDAFAYARQMQQNRQFWDVVILDPPKLIASREEAAQGRHKYEDLNSLAATLVKPGGLLVTCSCSGLLAAEDFEFLVCRGIHRQNRRLQILERTGAGPDHPVMSSAPEGRYLKVLWGRVWPA